MAPDHGMAPSWLNVVPLERAAFEKIARRSYENPVCLLENHGLKARFLCAAGDEV